MLDSYPEFWVNEASVFTVCTPFPPVFGDGGVHVTVKGFRRAAVRRRGPGPSVWVAPSALIGQGPWAGSTVRRQSWAQFCSEARDP